MASSRLARAGFRASARGSLSAEEGGGSSERADPERGLSRVLGEELEHERTTYTPSEVVTKGPPEPFEIIESDGDCEVTLTRAYGDDEEIAITFNATEDPYDEDDAILPAGADEGDEDEDEDVAIHFLVSVSRGDGEEALEFSCATDGETVEVRNVRYESLADGLEDDAMGAGYLSAYPGPNYDELDESVQESSTSTSRRGAWTRGSPGTSWRCTSTRSRRSTRGGSKTSPTSSPRARANESVRARTISTSRAARRFHGASSRSPFVMRKTRIHTKNSRFVVTRRSSCRRAGSTSAPARSAPRSG